MISAISNLGQLWFMVFKGRYNAPLFTEFLGRLLRSTGERKVYLIVDTHPVHVAGKVKQWLEEKPNRSSRLELVYLPGYSPDINPNECLNHETKQAMRQTPAA
jgi:transposase